MYAAGTSVPIIGARVESTSAAQDALLRLPGAAPAHFDYIGTNMTLAEYYPPAELPADPKAMLQVANGTMADRLCPASAGHGCEPSPRSPEGPTSSSPSASSTTSTRPSSSSATFTSGPSGSLHPTSWSSWSPTRLWSSWVVAFDAVVSEPASNSFPLEDIRVPTLLVHAADDRLAPYECVPPAAARIPGARLVTIEAGGHLFLDHAADVRQATTAFVRDLVRQDGQDQEGE